MADARAKELTDLGTGMFSKRQPLDGLLQELAENFYPERASFTSELSLGDDFAAHLMDSYPILMRRELGNAISAMLRPRNTPWFGASMQDDRLDEAPANAQWLEAHSRKIKKQMYHPMTQFIRASKEGDHDFVTFGQDVTSIEERPDRMGLLYRNWHLRDNAWLENDTGVIDHNHRKDKMSARNMKRKFGEGKLHESVKKACEKNPAQTFNIRHVVMPSDEYDYVSKGQDKPKNRLPFVSIYIDADNCEILREGGLPFFPYIISRWHTISGSQYAFSPATIVALPDARLAQQMGRIILEVGEKQVDPPLIATEDAIRSDIDLRSGAITYVDYAYDEKLGEALRKVDITGDMRTAFEMRQDFREMLTQAFFVNKLTLPQPEGADQMTAYEVGRRVEEFARAALPLFEPMEVEKNAQLLDKTHFALMNMGLLSFKDAPPDIQERQNELTFSFESPIQAAADRVRVSQFAEVMQLLAGAMAQDEQGNTVTGISVNPVDMDTMLKDAIRGTGAPADWMKTDGAMEAEDEANQQQQSLQQGAELVAQGAGVAGVVGESTTKLREAGLI